MAAISVLALSNVSESVEFERLGIYLPAFSFSLVAIVHLDQSLEILMAVRDCDFCNSSHHNDCGTPTRVRSFPIYSLLRRRSCSRDI